MIHDSGNSPPTFYGTSYGRSTGGSWKDACKRHDGRFIAADGYARDSMGGNEDVFAEFDGWQVMAKRRNGDEERGRVFIGFDDYTISRNR